MSDIPRLPEVAPLTPEVRLRLWPAVLIVIIHVSVALYTLYFGATNTESMIGFIGAPVLALLLLLVWWLAASRAPWRSRLVGVLLAAAALGCAAGAQKGNPSFILLAVIPALTTAVVAAMALTFGLRWPLRRWVLAAVIAVCGLVFSMLRADSLSSSLTPVMTWRWTPTAKELLQSAPAAQPGGTAVLPAQAGPGDWPAFRGPARDNRMTGMKFSTDWSTPPRELWRKRVGTGWSSYIAVGDHIFTQEQSDGQELVTCSRADTGAEVWVNRLQTHYENDMGDGPRATPAFEAGRLYTLGATGTLQCLDAATGKAVWTRDIKADAQTGVPGWGFASSPLVVGDKLIVFTHGGDGKSLIGYDRMSGEPAWRAGRGGGGYSSPQLSVVADMPQVLMAGEFGIQSFVPGTGEVLWERQVAKELYPRCAQPLVADGNMVLLGSPAGTGARMFQIQKKESALSASEAWTSGKFRPYFDDMVFLKGNIYGYDGDRICCVNAATGEMRWEGKRYGGQVLLVADMEMLLVVGEKGDVILIPANPAEFKEVARFKAISGKTWNHPTIAHGRLFVRNAEEAACFELPAIP
jgi:outer membrane protein assembly factor BamB